MAGVTDQPFRQLCLRLGAGLAVSEMVTSDTRLWHTRKSSLRLVHKNEPEPRSVQIAGNDPQQMAAAAQMNVQQGAQIIDINMGCPAKKVCKKAAGSALLRDEALVTDIVRTVTAAVSVPVTLKIRTGWSASERNGVAIAKIAEDNGIAALSVHGRTRECRFRGTAEYDTIAEIKQAVSIPVIANGDIDSASKAKQVMEYTKADAIMVGRAAQGRPWIFREINHFLNTGEQLASPGLSEIESLMTEHVSELHKFYGEFMGVRIARKHVGWYIQSLPASTCVRQTFNRIEHPAEQLLSIHQIFEELQKKEEIAA